MRGLQSIATGQQLVEGITVAQAIRRGDVAMVAAFQWLAGELSARSTNSHHLGLFSACVAQPNFMVSPPGQVDGGLAGIIEGAASTKDGGHDLPHEHRLVLPAREGTELAIAGSDVDLVAIRDGVPGRCESWIRSVSGY